MGFPRAEEPSPPFWSPAISDFSFYYLYLINCGAIVALAKIQEALALTYNPQTPNDQRVAAQKVRCGSRSL